LPKKYGGLNSKGYYKSNQHFNNKLATSFFIIQADYFKTICQKLSESAGVDAGKINLYFKDQLLNEYDSLKTVPLRISDIIGMFYTRLGLLTKLLTRCFLNRCLGQQ
jgi:hypothetical protein